MSASGGVPGWAMNQEWYVCNNMHGGFATNTMSTTWSCKAICQWWTCHDKRNGGKLHGNISRNGYGNAIIGRYGGCFEEDHRWNIQAKFYNEKFPLVYESDKTRDSLSWRSWCYFEAQVWKKDSSIVPLFSAFPSFFYLAFLFFIWPFFGTMLY